MRKIPIFQVDAFAGAIFQGNPAAVIPLDGWLSNAKMQSIAGENNLAETAFFVPRGDDYELRWFTPRAEVNLCGHATLATAFVLFNLFDIERDSVRFFTRSGELGVERQGELLTLDFPRLALYPCDAPRALQEGLSRPSLTVFKNDEDPNYFAILETEDAVRSLAPRFDHLERLHPYGTVITARGESADFVSRYFAPSYGIPEDPVTGSIHCALVPYWAERLGKEELFARQLSERGGELTCQLLGDRVAIGGKALLYMEGVIFV